MFVEDAKTGFIRPSFAFIDPLTVKAHPLIIEALLGDARRMWSLDEVLSGIE